MKPGREQLYGFFLATLLLAAVVARADGPRVVESAGCIQYSVTFQTKDATAADTPVGPGGFTFSPWSHIGPEPTMAERLDTIAPNADLAACFTLNVVKTQFEVQYTCEDRYFRVSTRHMGDLVHANAAQLFRVDLAETTTSTAFNIGHLFGSTAYTNKAGHQSPYEEVSSDSLVTLTQGNFYGVLFYINNGVTQNFHSKGLSHIRFADDTCARGEAP